MAGPTYAQGQELFELLERLIATGNLSEEAVAGWINGIKQGIEQRQRMVEHLNRSVDELNLSIRSANCLKNLDIRFVCELVQRTEAEMLKTKNFGPKSLRELREILAGMGLAFGMQSVPGLELPLFLPPKPFE